jgi:hypothetical protein
VEGVEPCANLVDPDNPHRDRIYVCPFDGNFRPAKQYSLILMLDVLEHLEHPVGALQHALDLLVPKGIVIVTVPAFMTLWTNHDVLNHHLTRYTKQRFREVARRSGLAIQEDRYFYHWTCPVKLVAHIVEGIFHPSPEPQAPKDSSRLGKSGIVLDIAAGTKNFEPLSNALRQLAHDRGAQRRSRLRPAIIRYW